MCAVQKQILKIKFLVSEGFDIDDRFKPTTDYTCKKEELIGSHKFTLGDEGNAVPLQENTREASDNISGYIAHKAQKYCKGCCYDQLFCGDTTTQTSSYITIISRGGTQDPF